MTEIEHTVTDLVVHKLIKHEQGPADVVLRGEACRLTDAVVRLVERLCKLYRDRPGKGYGRFEEDEATFPMPAFLRRHIVEREIDFAALTRQMMEHLKQLAEQEELEEGGFVLIARIREGEADCLWVALLTEALGTAIDAQLNVVDSAHLDLASLKAAGRVDLSAWRRGDERYISFLKGRGDVAHYFKRFLGCSDVVIALKETQKLVQTLTHFAETERLEAPVRDELLERAHVYLDELGESGAPVSLDTVAREVWPAAPERLDEMLQADATKLASGFVPDRRALRPLVRFKASAEQWKLEFDRSGLRSGAVTYDRASDTLVLSNLPDYLKRMLLDE